MPPRVQLNMLGPDEDPERHERRVLPRRVDHEQLTPDERAGLELAHRELVEAGMAEWGPFNDILDWAVYVRDRRRA